MNLYELAEMVEQAKEACVLSNIDPKRITVVSIDYNSSMPVKHTEFDPKMLLFKLNVNK